MEKLLLNVVPRIGEHFKKIQPCKWWQDAADTASPKAYNTEDSVSLYSTERERAMKKEKGGGGVVRGMSSCDNTDNMSGCTYLPGNLILLF